MKQIIAITVLLLAGMAARADQGGGALNVSATVDGSISLLFVSDPSGVSLTGSGTSAAAAGFGTLQGFGSSPPLGITITRTSSEFSPSTPFYLKVVKANSISASCTVRADIGASDGNVWKIDHLNLNTGTKTITSSGTYNANLPFTLKVNIPFSRAAGAINNSLNFTATAN
jgi:hypothetical protein